MEYRIVPFEVKQTREEGDYFIVEGKASVYGNIDLVDDIVESGCFYEDLKQNGNERPSLWMHKWDEPLGVGTYTDFSDHLFVKMRMPKEDVFVKGRVIPQIMVGSVTGLSIGYNIEEYAWDQVGTREVRRLKKCRLKETSPVTFPANEEARIEMVKSFKSHSIEDDSLQKKSCVLDFMDYDISDDTKFDKLKSVKQIKENTDSNDKPSKAYRKGFFICNDEKEFTGFKMPYVYWEDGKFRVIPKALSAIVGALSGKCGIDITDQDKQKIKSQINKYYLKMDREEPFKSNGNIFIDKKTLEGLEKRDYSKLFDANIILSSQAKKKIIDNLSFGNETESVKDNSFLNELKEFNSKLQGDNK